MAAFSRSQNSYLAEAQALDMELYELTKDEPKGRDAGPSLVDETVVVSMLKTISEQLQQIAQYTHYAAAGAGIDKKAKVKPLPRAKTARDIWERQDAWNKYQFLESVIKYVPQDEFDRIIEESRGE